MQRTRRPHFASNQLSRRQLLSWGGAGYLGLNLPGIIQAQATQAGSTGAAASKIKACIFLFYYGGPSHLDMYDMKPHAPAEVRGEFRPIATSVPGLHISEHLPRMAKVMHKVALIRSMHHANRLHDSASTEVHTGRPSPHGDREEAAPIAQFFPCFGATLNFLAQARDLDVPHAALPYVFHNVVDVPCQGGGFLGARFDPLQITVDAQQRSYSAGALARQNDLPPQRMAERRRLLDRLESLTRPYPQAAQLQRIYDQASRLLSSRELHRALNLQEEPARVRDRYGHGPVQSGSGNGADRAHARHMRGQNLLLARRLVEAGLPFVNVHDCRQQGQNWDAHARNFEEHKHHLLPLADQSLSALIEDLDVRGLLDSTLIVATGEFGRTPRINNQAGRDHWPDCYTVLLAGGGVKGGFVHGASDRIGAYPALDPVTPADLAATIYWRFGIDPATEVHDQTGRPWRIADGTPIRQLFA